MKTFLSLILATIYFTGQSQTKQLNGAFTSQNGDTTRLWLFVDDYASHILFRNKEYIGTTGGPFIFDGRTITIRTEYNDLHPSYVGSDLKMSAEQGKNRLLLNGDSYHQQTTKRQNLDGLWRITGRESDSQMSQISRSDRKTIKILIDGFFQWVAINPAVKGFYGTGGGHYTFSSPTYMEQILFFSRDNTRVGTQLVFKGELNQNQWHHSGKSSKGDPIYEIWSKEQ